MFGGNFFDLVEALDRLGQLRLDVGPGLFAARELRQELANVNYAPWENIKNILENLDFQKLRLY